MSKYNLYDNIPQALKDLPQWVVHKDKIPYNPLTNRRAKAGQPETWAAYEDALSALSTKKYSGFGFELNHNGLVGLDIDKCVDPETGEVSSFAQSIVDELDSYTEYSPSGLGLHIFVFGDIPSDGRKDSKHGLEIYKALRYLTVTGNIYEARKELSNRPNEILALYNTHFAEADVPLSKPDFNDEHNDSWLYESIIQQASNAENGELFRKLFAGDWQNTDKGYESQSEADLGLCNILVYWAGGNVGLVDDLFQMSGLMREKWTTKRGKVTYGEQTIAKALSQTSFQPFASLIHVAPLKTISAQDLQTKYIPPIKWFVKDLIPQGLTMIVAPPKAGKSWLMLDLCLSVASGQSFLGKETFQRECLYLALEDSQGRLKGRMLKLLAFDENAPAGFDYALDVDPINAGFQEQVEEYINTHKNLGLIIVDTVQRIRGMSNSRNAYAQDYADFTVLKKIADRHSIGVILVHHTKKGKDETDPFMQISGTNGLLGVVDTALVLERQKRSDGQATLYITGRDVEAPDLAIEFNKDLCRWLVLGNADHFAEQERRDAYEGDSVVLTIKALLEGIGFWQGTTQDIFDAGFFQEDVRTIGKRLASLEPQFLQYDGITHILKRSNGKNIHRFEYDLLQ